jgi:hypothetical protein
MHDALACSHWLLMLYYTRDVGHYNGYVKFECNDKYHCTYTKNDSERRWFVNLE